MAQFQRLSLQDQIRTVERHHLETLLFCDDAWALRHSFINEQTGEEIRARCDRWTCLTL